MMTVTPADGMQAKSVPPRKKRQLSKWLVFALLISTFANGLTIHTAREWRETNRIQREYQLPQWLHNATLFAQMADLEGVYICEVGGLLPAKPAEFTPCPDYVARAEFRGNREDTPPVLYPATNAKGQVVIELRAQWLPEECGDAQCAGGWWFIESTFADSVVRFAFNAYSDPSPDCEDATCSGRRYEGPRFFTPARAEYATYSFGNDGVEVYAGDRDTNIVGLRLTDAQLGQW